jgi:hypothetical protein
MSETRAQPTRPIALPGEVAAGAALGGMMLGMAGLGGGWLPVGVVGLVTIGLALGFSGTLRSRIAVAASIWTVATALAAVSAAFGSIGFAVAGSMVFGLTCVASGQCVGLVAGAAVRHANALESG